MDSFISFHSCKVDPHWYGARTSNPWENKRSAVRFRLLYVRQTNISTRVRMNVQCQLRQLQQQQWLILFIVFFNFLEHFFWTLFCFHSCKVDPHWCGAQTSNPWESRHSAVRLRPVCVQQTNISQKLISTIEHIPKKAEAVGSVYSTCIFFVKNSNRTWIGIFRCHHPIWNSSPLSPLKKNIITVIYHLFIIIIIV